MSKIANERAEIVQLITEAPLTEALIEEHKYKIDRFGLWGSALIRALIGEHILREFSHHLDWFWVSRNQDLSLEFVQEFESKIDWEAFSANIYITDEIIEHYKGKINWSILTFEQQLSFQTISNNLDRINFNDLEIENNKKLTDEQKSEIRSITTLRKTFH